MFQLLFYHRHVTGKVTKYRPEQERIQLGHRLSFSQEAIQCLKALVCMVIFWNIISNMFTLRDFYHLPQLDPLIERMVGEASGLLVIAGLDSQPGVQAEVGGFLPSGRHALFGLFIDTILAKNPKKKCIVVAQDDKVVRVQRQFRKQLQIDQVASPHLYAKRIAADSLLKPGLLVIDRLDTENVVPALEAARQSLVLSQLNTVFHGAEVLRQLLELSRYDRGLVGNCWVLTVQRMPALCLHCRQTVSPTLEQLEPLQEQYSSGESADRPNAFYRSTGCSECNHTGRSGDVAIFDVFHTERTAETLSTQLSLLQFTWDQELHLGADLLRAPTGRRPARFRTGPVPTCQPPVPKD